MQADLAAGAKLPRQQAVHCVRWQPLPAEAGGAGSRPQAAWLASGGACGLVRLQLLQLPAA